MLPLDSAADGETPAHESPSGTLVPARLSGFSPAELTRSHSWGSTCAHTAIIPTNNTIDVSAAASSTNIFNMTRSLLKEHNRNIVLISFFRQERRSRYGKFLEQRTRERELTSGPAHGFCLRTGLQWTTTQAGKHDGTRVRSGVDGRRVRGVSTAGPAAARDYPFCIKGSDYASSTGDCRFDSYGACQASASGLFAYCDANPFFRGSPPVGVPRVSRRAL